MLFNEPDVFLAVTSRNLHVPVEDVTDNRLLVVFTAFDRAVAVVGHPLRRTPDMIA